MKLPTLIASDIDGTLLPSNQIISDKTKEVLDRARSQGIKVMVATGRQPHRAKVVFDQFEHDGVAICSNGAALIDTTTMGVLHEELVPADFFPAMFEEWYAAIPGLNIYAEYVVGNMMTPDFDRHIADQLSHYFDIHYAETDMDIFNTGVLKLVLCCSGDRLVTEYTDIVEQMCEGKLAVTRSSDLFLEISKCNVSKRTALEVHCKQQGIAAEDVLAFGDMPNDAEMLSWAGHSVAMGSADDDVKALATGVTGTADEDGVANYIEAILDGKIAF